MVSVAGLFLSVTDNLAAINNSAVVIPLLLFLSKYLLGLRLFRCKKNAFTLLHDIASFSLAVLSEALWGRGFSDGPGIFVDLCTT
jgi:hypothetical protein